jgi:hypothetical protein
MKQNNQKITLRFRAKNDTEIRKITLRFRAENYEEHSKNNIKIQGQMMRLFSPRAVRIVQKQTDVHCA